MDGDLHGADVVGGPDLLGQLQHAHEHGRDPLAVGRSVLLDEGEGLRRVEVLHDHDGRPEAQEVHAEGQRGGVVERGGGEVDGVLVRPEDEADQRGHGLRGAQWGAGEGGLDALGPTGGARGVEHRHAFDGAGRLLGGLGGEQVLQRLAAVDGAADRRQQVEAAELVHELRHLVGLGRRGDQDPAARVLQDVAQLLGREAGADGRVVQPGVAGAPGQREVVDPVLQAEGDVVPGPQPERAEEVGQPTRRLVELGVGHHLARAPHHDRRVVRRLLRPRPRVLQVGLVSHR